MRWRGRCQKELIPWIRFIGITKPTQNHCPQEKANKKLQMKINNLSEENTT